VVDEEVDIMVMMIMIMIISDFRFNILSLKYSLFHLCLPAACCPLTAALGIHIAALCATGFRRCFLFVISYRPGVRRLAASRDEGVAAEVGQ
jgi:hypothetical protein